ncbi:uncharacterized protein LOC726343 [Apis mellifera]|uniref:Uncharacterized protein LOC726343 n=1 Tax=Apis mellifera TaxID=7460 RepID=A0A7M7M0Q4_APIME|nr:uncharacterized protein LOC726343 [Apis mellifera]|eukprot:XP_016768435.2 uncharacterized protein LOC726343 [Apis mellifera]
MHQTSVKCNVKLCSNNDVPPSSVIRTCLGPSLAQVFFDYTHHDTLKLLDVLITSKTSKPCFSIPEDQMTKNDVPPTDHQIIKAFVHQNILEIGEALLENLKKEVEENLKDKIERQSREKFYLYQAKKRREADLQTQQLHEKYQNFLESVRVNLQKQLEKEWLKAAEECAKNTQKAIIQERMNITQEMIRKMRVEITHITQSLYNDFEKLFCAKRDTIIADFNQIMRERQIKFKNEIRELKEKANRDMYIQKRQFEMQSVTDIIYVLCLERVRSNKEKHAIHRYFEERIDEFYELIIHLRDIINIMKEEIINCHTNKKSLEEKLYNVTKHFQKFINFIFHALPGQADYLLPPELQELINLDIDEEDKKIE